MTRREPGSIKAVAKATGVTVETPRAFEPRYGVIHPERGGSGRRIHSCIEV
jgi:DNA-binding transcriptional MerR regulator